MKVNKHLRNLLMEQSETVMLSRSECYYLGTRYTFTPVVQKDTDVRVAEIRKALDLDAPKKWYQFWK